MILNDVKDARNTIQWVQEHLANWEDEDVYIKAIWETKGREYGLKLINSEWLTSASTATYTAPVSEIPSGYSYVTIFHFADGTSVMSEVKQK